MYAVIMAGGSGTRFWPVSRDRAPKQFLNITGKAPMVVETCERLRALADEEQIILVLGERHLKTARELFRGRQVHMLGEPVGRNTAPCIGLGAVYAEHLGCRGAVAFLPADHFIGDAEAFGRALSAAGGVAESGGIVTLGIVPTRPETGYGYIRRSGDWKDAGGQKAYSVVEFVEKPDLHTAQRFLSSGEYYWNAGIFVATPRTIIDEIEKHMPDLYDGLMRIKEALKDGRLQEELAQVYPDLESISFDYGIMEKTNGPVFVVPCECGWSDVGSWASIHELRQEEHDQRGNFSQGETLLIDCDKSFVSAGGDRLVACVGLKNCLVVDTPEALLVADLDHCQKVRRVVDELKKRGKGKLL